MHRTGKGAARLDGIGRQADRETRRAAMAMDPDWRSFSETSAKPGAFMTQENSITRPVPFFEIFGGKFSER